MLELINTLLKAGNAKDYIELVREARELLKEFNTLVDKANLLVDKISNLKESK